MPIQDYYKTLEIPALASATDIKQAYRKLARQYHPDKNNNNEKATTLFQELQAAYEVLSDPAKRKAYDNELKYTGRYTAYNKDQVNNAAQIVKQTKDLLRYIDTMSNRSINYDALTDFILGILNNDNIALLLRSDDSSNNQQITTNILNASRDILAIRSFTEIAARLQLLCPDDALSKRIQQEFAQRQHKERQNRLVPYISIIIIIIIMFITFIMS